MGIINFVRGIIKPIYVCYSDIPESIIAEILVALPTQSIIRFRCVCKIWLRLITSRYFNDVLLTKRSSLTFLTRGEHDQYRLFEFQDSLTKSPCLHIEAMKLNFKFGAPFSGSPKVIGSCNGLFSLLERVHACSSLFIHIWNPVLGQYITFPIGQHCVYIRIEGYGFGYSHITDQYKVIRIVKKEENLFVVEVLSLSNGTNTWRIVGITHSRPNKSSGYCYFNGIVHYIGIRNYITANWEICSFNNCTEQIGFVSPPPLVGFRFIYYTGYEYNKVWLDLKVVNESFCLVVSTNEGFVLWSMKDYGVADSWSKHMFVKFTDSFRSDLNLTTLGYDEEFLFRQYIHSQGYLNSKDKQYKKLKTIIGDGGIHDVYRYFPNFVPLLEVFKEVPSKMLVSHKGCFRLLLSSLRNYIHK